MYYERTKYIDVRMYFIKDIIEQEIVQVKKIPTIDNPADIITEPVSIRKLRHCPNLIVVQNI